MVRADKAYFLTHRGDVVGEDHPDRHTLLCKAGEAITDDLARNVGLIAPVELPVEAPALVVEAEAEVQAVTTPPRTQAVKPPNKKTSPRKR
jgi:hypothetical protein